MKVIDLLVKIANKEKLPERIKFNSEIYLSNEVGAFLTEDGRKNFIGNLYFIEELNYEVEIIEEDKPIEELDYEINENNVDTCIEKIRCKINELIDEVNKLKKENE